MSNENNNNLVNSKLINQPINIVCIHGKRWFDRVNGNTYHTVTVSVNGEYIGKSSRQYGYGDSYQQTALDMLFSNGIFIKRDYEPCFTLACSDRGFKYFITVSDVKKSEL